MNPLFDRAIAKQEADLGVPMEYLRKIADNSTRAFLKFGMFSSLALHRKATSPEVWHLARLAATHVQDCGTCVQVVVNAALSEGVAPDLIRAALGGDELASDHQLAVDYGQAVSSNSHDVPALVEQVRERWGEEALNELALAVATAQVFPVVKRGMGLAVACSLVQVDVGDR
ncbi:MAG: hypothetical protein Rubg2KO_19820 [Rubricoccaceae bacterium]